MAPPTRSHVALATLAVVLAVFVAFASTRDNGFVNWDDDVYITRNPHVQSLSAANVAWMLRNTHPQWGPLAFFLHAVDIRLFGMDPGAHHLMDVALHAAAAALVLWLFLALSRRAAPEWGGVARLAGGVACAVLFAVHPLRVESVAWASEKKDLLFAIFTIGALIAWLSYGSALSRRARVSALVVAHACCALALMAKPMAVTLPVLLLILDVYPLDRASWRSLPRLLGEKLLLVIMAGCVVWITVRPPREEVPRMRVGAIERSARALLPLRSATFHLQKTLWPTRLLPFYPAPPAERRRLADPEFALSAVALGLLTAAGLWRWRRGERCWLAAWAFYLVGLLPVSGLRPLAGQVGADRFTYVPTLPLFVLLGVGVALAWTRGNARKAAVVLVAATALGLGAMTHAQIARWQDSETFWSYVADALPGQVVMAHNNLGAIYHERGLRSGSAFELARAEAQYLQAIAMVPEHANAWNNLGLIHEQRGEWDEAERCYRRALSISPRHPQAGPSLRRLLARRQAASPAP